jgi:hypothetical protein
METKINMKNILGIVCLSVVLSLTAFADGEMGQGNKTCTSNCPAFRDTTVEVTVNPDKTTTLIDTKNDYLNKILDYLTELAF